METDVDSLLCAGVGTNRLENAGSPVHRLTPTRRDAVVRDTAHVRSRGCASYGLSGWRDRHIRSNRGTVSAARPAHNGDARLARNLFAGRTCSSAAPDSQEPAEVAGTHDDACSTASSRALSTAARNLTNRQFRIPDSYPMDAQSDELSSLMRIEH